jgi:phosphoribulokinase
VSVFLDPDPELRIRWKIARDCAVRGYSPDGVRAQILHRRADAERYIMPQRERAHIVVGFYPGPTSNGDGALLMHAEQRPGAPGELAALVLAAAERARRIRGVCEAGPAPTK